jgi:hypothetical protein
MPIDLGRQYFFGIFMSFFVFSPLQCSNIAQHSMDKFAYGKQDLTVSCNTDQTHNLFRTKRGWRYFSRDEKIEIQRGILWKHLLRCLLVFCLMSKLSDFLSPQLDRWRYPLSFILLIHTVLSSTSPLKCQPCPDRRDIVLRNSITQGHFLLRRSIFNHWMKRD